MRRLPSLASPTGAGAWVPRAEDECWPLRVTAGGVGPVLARGAAVLVGAGLSRVAVRLSLERAGALRAGCAAGVGGVGSGGIGVATGRGLEGSTASSLTSGKS